MKQSLRKGYSALNKSLFAASLLSVSMLMPSCQSSADGWMPTDEPQPQSVATRAVSFSLSTFSEQQLPMTRESQAEEIQANPTRLLVLDVVNGTVVQTIQKTTVQAQAVTGVTQVTDVLENLSLNLTYGSHDIYILAAHKSYSSFSATDLTVSWSANPSYTWAIQKTVNVTTSSANAENVSLPLVVGMVQLICNDDTPTEAKSMEVKGTMCWDLDLTTMKGILPEANSPWSTISTISDRAAGSQINIFSFPPTDSKISTLTFKAMQADGATVATHTLTDVPVTAAYITQYTGSFYSNTQGFTLSTTNQWSGITSKTY